MMSTTDQDKTVIGYPVCPDQVDTGYPLSQPRPSPPPPPPPSTQENVQNTSQPSYETSWKDYLIVASILFGMLVFIVGIYYLRYPSEFVTPKVPTFMVESATIYRLNTTRSELTATWNITLLANNPNSKSFHDHGIQEAWVFYGNHSRVRLAATTLPHLVLNKRHHPTRVDLRLVTVSQPIDDNMGQEIFDDKSRGLVKFGVGMLTCLKGGIRSFKSCLVVTCDKVQFDFFFHNETATLREQRKCKDQYWMTAYQISQFGFT